MKKYRIMINNIRFKTISGKINKIPEFYTIFRPKNARFNTTTRSRPSRGQMFEAEAEAEAETEAKISASRPLWPLGLNITVDNNAGV